MAGTTYGVAPPTPQYWFGPHYSGETLDYTFDISSAVAVGQDILSTLTVAIAPSGAGELTASNLSVNGTLLTITVSGGQPTRTYTVLFTATMTDGRVYQFVVNQLCAAILPTDQAAAPPSAGFGTPMTWTNAPITTNGLVVTLPANAVLRAIYIQNTTANAITGGLNIGTAALGNDIASAIAVGANALVVLNSETLLSQWFSTTTSQGVYFSAVGAWSGASLTVRVEYDV